MHDFEKKILDFVTENQLLKEEHKILLAVSGGADSTALLHCMASLQKAGAVKNGIAVAHINHQLRGELADRDEQFVIEQSKMLEIEVHTAKVDVSAFAQDQKLSIETAARQLRRQELAEIAAQSGCDVIATAHNKNDNAETLIHRISRGTGYRGLCGIWPKKDFESFTFIRPLLGSSRKEITQYLDSKGLSWQSDHTNEEIVYTRNFIRHKLLPQLQKQNQSDIIEMLFELAKRSQRLQLKLDNELEKRWPGLVISKTSDSIELNLLKLQDLALALKMEAFRRALVEIGSGERDLTQGHYNQMLRVCEPGGSKKMRLPGGFEVIRSKSLVISKRMQALAAEAKELAIPGVTEWNGWQIETRLVKCKSREEIQEFIAEKSKLVEWFDFDKIKGTLNLRTRQQADRFKPIGFRVGKRVGKFLTDAQISPLEKERVFVVADAEKIIWVAPLRASDETKIRKRTRKILQIKVNSKGF
jgi:tRNA(Ile)-lysidine synthase